MSKKIDYEYKNMNFYLFIGEYWSNKSFQSQPK